MQDAQSEFHAFGVADGAAEEVEARFVHADQTDCAEVMVEAGQINLSVRKEFALEVFGDDLAFDFQRFFCQVHQVIQTRHEFVFVFAEVAQSRHVDCNNANRTGLFARAEKPARLVAEFAHVHLQAAAHRADVAGVKV